MWKILKRCFVIGLVAQAAPALDASAAPPGAPRSASAADRSGPQADPLFAEPYVDIDEWRDTPVPHRYVHGGFRGTDTRFSFYLPPKAQYRGRFFQHFTPAPDSENLAQHLAPGEENKIGFAIASGGYFVETNGGGRGNTSGPGFSTDPTISAWRANAAAARYSRVIALQMYGGKRPFGYAFGGSGGAYRTVGAFENTHGVWDGVVPYVLGSSNASPSNFTVRMNAMRVLQGQFPRILDAVEPGGGGDPYAGLTAGQAAALREATDMGFPVRSWFGYRTMGIHAFAALYGGMLAADPTYFTDFWTKPGYLGFDHPEALAGDRMQHQAKVVAAITAAEAGRLGLNTRVVDGTVNGGVDNSFGVLQGDAAQRVVAFRLDAAPPKIDFLGGDLIVLSGAAQGVRLTVSRIADDVVILGVADPLTAAKLAPGDTVRVDNSNFLAAQTYHRHQVPGPEFIGWNPFRGPDGRPLYPQRPMLLGPLFTMGAAGALPTGRWEGKMILVESLWDREAFAWQADWYRGLVRKNLGAAEDQHFRVWFTDHALHGDSSRQEDPTRTVSYLGVLDEALRDLSAWVEKGVPPPASTAYKVVGGQVVVPPTAAERHGIQPVVTVKANGGVRAEVAVGQPVTFAALVEAPPRTGKIVSAEWDFEGAGDFPVKVRIARPYAARVSLRTTYTFAKPGTYFPTLRAASQRHGDDATPFARIQNLDRVRVVVRRPGGLADSRPASTPISATRTAGD